LNFRLKDWARFEYSQLKDLGFQDVLDVHAPAEGFAGVISWDLKFEHLNARNFVGKLEAQRQSVRGNPVLTSDLDRRPWAAGDERWTRLRA